MDMVKMVKKLLGADDPAKPFPNKKTYVGAAAIGAVVAVVLLYWQYVLLLAAVVAIVYIRSRRQNPTREANDGKNKTPAQ